MPSVTRKIIEEYEINPHTMLIIPTVYGSKIYSKIIEVDDEFICPFPPKSIIQKGCLYFGISYEGRITGSKQLIGNHNKVPITLDSQNSIYFFPTTSPQNDKCIWIAHDHVDKYFPTGPKLTRVAFKNKTYFDVAISYPSFDKQMLRTIMLRMKLTSRIEDARKKTFYC